MVQYFLRVAREFHHIRWLSPRRAGVLTGVVILVTLVSGFVFGAVDGFFSGIIKKIVV